MALQDSRDSQASRTALITGASRGLGLALAKRLAQDGWMLILDARGTQALEAARVEITRITSTARVIAVPGDVTDPAHRKALAEAAQSVGGLDALINNASSLGPSPRPALLDYPLAELEAVYQANVVAPLGLIQALHTHLKPDARLINVSSDAGVEVYDGWGGYGSSKAALEQLSAILAAEHPDWRVYWVDPGDMRTQMHQEAFPGEDISDRPLPDESVPGFMALLTEDWPSGRYRAREMPSHPAGSTDQANPPKFAVRGLRLVLTVNNFNVAARFYRDGLALAVRNEWLSDQSKGVLFDVGQATLELVDEAQAAEVDQIEVGRRSAGPVRVAFTVDQVEAASDSLRSRGAALISGPVDTPWGHRNVRLQAPHNIQPGIQLTLSEVRDESQIEAESNGES